MNIWSWSVDDWNATFQTLTIIFIAGTVLTSLGALFTGRRVSKRQAQQLADANAEAAKANKGVAETGFELAKAKEGTAQAVKETARLTVEAEEAKKERAETDKQIAIAKADAAKAKEGIANAEARSQEASAEVSRLHVTVANAETRRLEAERALAEVQKRVKDRHLTSEQRNQLVQFLKANRGGFVQMKTTVGDREAFDFAEELVQAIAEAKETGWQPKCCDRERLPLNLSGIVIWVRAGGKGPPLRPRTRVYLRTNRFGCEDRA